MKKAVRVLASLKVAIPLLVLLIGVTVVGSLFPTPDVFKSNWYLGLLGILGTSLVFVTIMHAPSILKRKGRNALLGVIVTHLGILVLIVGVIIGGFSGFRHQIRLIEGESTVIPGVPFVIRLENLEVEEYAREDFPIENMASLPKKKQDSHITLFRQGRPWQSHVVAPGRPAVVDGITLLPAINDIGWYFELIVMDSLKREKTIPVRPWDPPMILVGDRRVVTHSAQSGELLEAELFEVDEENERLLSLGVAGKDKPLEIDGSHFRLGPVKRYTAMQVYNRPQEPVLVAGSVLMFLGLVWHFYFRHRDRRREGRQDA